MSIFSNTDILEKECQNELFKLECYAEATGIQTVLMATNETMFTESEEGGKGGLKEKIAAIKAKIVELFNTIKSKIQEVLDKLFSKSRRAKLEAQLKAMEEDLKKIQDECRKNPELAKKIQNELDGTELHDIKDLQDDSQSKQIASNADKLQAFVKNCQAKISKGELVSAEEIAMAKALGDLEPVKVGKMARIAAGVQYFLARLGQINSIIVFAFSVVTLNLPGLLLSSATYMVNDALMSGCMKIQTMEEDDAANVKANAKRITEGELIANASTCASTIAQVSNALERGRISISNSKLRAIISDMNKIVAAYKKYAGEGSADAYTDD